MRVIHSLLVAMVLCLVLAPLALAEDAPKSCPPQADPADCNTQGRWGAYRMYVSASGMGYVRCNSCRTDQGCTSFWTDFGYNARCEAFPAPGNSFSHWTANDQYAGTDKVKTFGKVGLRIVGNFKGN